MSFKRRVKLFWSYFENRKDFANINFLDAGCGEGYYITLLKDLTKWKITGIEFDAGLVDQARRWNFSSENDRNLSIEQDNLLHLKFDDEIFDLVLCSEVLEHIDDDIRAAKEIYRVLKKDGSAFITVPNVNYPFIWDPLNWIRKKLNLGHFSSLNTWFGGIWSYDHKRLYSVETLSNLLINAGFEIVEVKVLTHHGIPFNILILQLFKKLLTSRVVPNGVRESAEKFSTFQSHSKDIFNFPIVLINFLDRLNNVDFALNKSTMNISILARKPSS